MRRNAASQAQEWAEKKRMQMERAKQLKEERKNSLQRVGDDQLRMPARGGAGGLVNIVLNLSREEAEAWEVIHRTPLGVVTVQEVITSTLIQDHLAQTQQALEAMDIWAVLPTSKTIGQA